MLLKDIFSAIRAHHNIKDGYVNWEDWEDVEINVHVVMGIKTSTAHILLNPDGSDVTEIVNSL